MALKNNFFLFLVLFFFSLSFFVALVDAGVLESSIIPASDGVHGSKITISWFQGADQVNLGPDACGFDNTPGNNVPYVFKTSDSSFKPNDDYDPTGCNFCGGNSACNEGLPSGVENYYCRNSDGSCNYCNGVCSSSSDCGTGYSCDTSSGTCNAQCVCDPATCSGSVCTNTASGSVETVYDGCSNNVCQSSTTTYDCPNCQDKICVLKSCNYDACHTSSDVGCPSGYSSDPSGDGQPDYWNYYVKQCP